MSADNGTRASGPRHAGSAADDEAARVAARLKQRMALQKRMSAVTHKILVFSGKGGVGKSTVSAGLAVALAAKGRRTGVLDVDFHGPSIPVLMGLTEARVEMDGDNICPVTTPAGVRVMSLGLLLRGRDDAVIWRGPRKMGAIQQLLSEVAWEGTEVLIIDSPPGTGDEPLSIAQSVEDLSGAILVTTPQEVALADVRRSLSFCRQLDVPVLGVVENMSGFVCPSCGAVSAPFKRHGGEALASDAGVPFLGAVPLDPALLEACDRGELEAAVNTKSATAAAFAAMAEALSLRLDAIAAAGT